MAYKNYLKRIEQRDLNLVRYAAKHPAITQHALARIFKIDQSRVSRILKKYRGNNGRRKPNTINKESET